MDETVFIGGIQKFSIEDGPGIRTTVFFKGCPLNCKWCHNPELIYPQQQLIQSPNNCIGCGYCMKVCPNGAIYEDPIKGIAIDRKKCKVCLKCTENCTANALRPVARAMTVEEIMQVVQQDKAFYDNTGGGLTVSGGEVLMHTKFVSRLIDEAGKKGINACIDTCGYGNPNELMGMALKENVTDILYDIKSVDNSIHKKYTGVDNDLILKNLELLSTELRTEKKLTVRMPLIKGVNDSLNIIKKTGILYKSIGVKRVDLIPYHSLGVRKQYNMGGIQEIFERPSEHRLKQIEKYLKARINLEVKILGET